MKFIEFLRNKAFWFLDSLKGGEKRDHYNEIEFIINNPLSPKTVDLKKEKLDNILRHAVGSVDFYKEYTNYSSLEEFPVVDKNTIKNNFGSFQSNLFLDKPGVKVSTSGSTGTPFTVYQDKNKRIRNIADTLFFSQKTGYKLGNRLTYFRMWNAFEKKGKLASFLQNIVPIDVFQLKEKEVISTILQKLSKSKSSESWLGYASAYEEICKFLDENHLNSIPNNLQSIIAISEGLNEYTKQTIKKYFDTEVVSRYSNVENGIIAQQPLGDKEYFEINEASYFIEVLEIDSDIRVKDGESGRIVITDLYNYNMPLIRYDTGDIGIKSTIDFKPVFMEIRGRKIDVIYNTKGEMISVNLVLIVNKYPELNQCQLIQKNKGEYQIKLSSEKEFFRENELLNEFKVYLGEDAIITVEYVDEIPLLASGKRRVMVNQMINV